MYIVFIDFCNRKYLANIMIRSSMILTLVKLKPYIVNTYYARCAHCLSSQFVWRKRGKGGRYPFPCVG